MVVMANAAVAFGHLRHAGNLTPRDMRKTCDNIEFLTVISGTHLVVWCLDPATKLYVFTSQTTVISRRYVAGVRRTVSVFVAVSGRRNARDQPFRSASD